MRRWILAALVASACSHAPVAETGPALGERFSLRAGESASIRGEGAAITFERILTDSRCAVDVQCIWAGEARGAFRFEKRGGPALSFELDTNREPVREVGGYQVSLLAVSPAPKSTVRIAPADYSAELTVSK